MPASFMRTAKTILLLVILVVIVGAGIAYVRHRTTPVAATGPGGRPAGPPGAAPAGGAAGGAPRVAQTTVKAAATEVADVPTYLSGLGTVTATNTAIVRARVGGQLMKLHFTEGQEVKAGQLLAELDPRTFQVALAQSEAELGTSRATLANARADLVRYRTLLQQESVASQRVDTQASLVQQLEASVKGGEATVAAARLQLEFSRVTAPISGRVGLKQVDIGNQVTTADANGIVIITQVQPINVIFPLPETRLPEVITPFYAGTALKVEAWNRENSKVLATGKLGSIDNQVDTTTGTFRLKAVFDNADHSLFPNQFVNARIQTGVLAQAVIAPSAAVQIGSQGSYVWVLGEDNKVKMQIVKTGPRDGEKIVITEGVAGGVRLITDGVDRLTDGMVVTLADAPPPARTAPASGAGRRARPGQ
jgi:multidrug efflux system membrane fusion protein